MLIFFETAKHFRNWLKPISHRISYETDGCVCAYAVCVNVLLSVKAKEVDSSATFPGQDQPTIVQMKKMWFRLRFFTVLLCTVEPPTQTRQPTDGTSTRRKPKACSWFSLFFLWKFTKTFRRHFVYFSFCCWDRRGQQQQQGKWKQDKSFSWLPFGRPLSLRFLLSSIHLLLLSLFLFILSLSLAISFKWCQSFFTCYAQVWGDYPALYLSSLSFCVHEFIIAILFNRQIGSDFEFIIVGGHSLLVPHYVIPLSQSAVWRVKESEYE